MLTLEKGVKLLQESGAKITSQRVAIMKSLEGRTDHPSAEQIFLELKPDYPTLSIATVYSTTQLLASASVIRILSIDDKKIYFDPVTSPHGHFMCRRCKRIVDVPIDFECIDAAVAHADISSVTNAELFLYGLCTDCGD
ncbi:transcriptional repressor [Synergistaceae bacterium OttesenSCG-928-I11]|nr:transcriptional repressor [Synergistaceae bacterium OttesenSCG-928-I11]